MPLKLNSTPEGTNNLLITILKQQMGIGTVQTVITDTAAYTAPSGSYWWAFKAIDGDVVIDTAKDINGTTISGLSGVTIKQSDILTIQLSYIKLTSGKAVLYAMNTDYVY